MLPLFLATASFQKNHTEPPKVAQLSKNAQSGHPGSLGCDFKSTFNNA